MRFYSTQYSLFGVSQGLQFILHIRYHHGKWSFCMGFQVPRSQLGHCGTQPLRVLLCQDGGDAQNTTGLWGGGGESRQDVIKGDNICLNYNKVLSENDNGCDVTENTDGGNVSNLEQSCSVADNVGELEDVGTELLLHVTQEQYCIIGGEPADGRHCRSNGRQKNTQILSWNI